MIPLSTAMRPENLESFVGQDHFFFEGSLLYNSIKSKTFNSAIFFGPSGTGKTTLARLIAKEMDSDFHEINASETGIKELKEIIENAKFKLFSIQRERTYLYIDEFHRWNRLQQDSLLKALEEGVVRFIGSTTENPYFAVNNAVLSRVRSVYEFKRLRNSDLVKILYAALEDKDRGLGKRELKWDDDAISMLADMANGDARIALDTLGFIANNVDEGKAIDSSYVGEAMQRQTLFYDKKEDKYNLLSALQKSIRGSDPDASLHYLARLVDGGADVLTIGRRLMVMASEDIGMAYPQAISIVTSCIQASLMVGFPEAKIILAQAAILLASSPKSNTSIKGIDKALKDIKVKNIGDVPLHLKDSHYSGAKERGIGIDYKYPHSYGGYVEQQYLPDSLHRDKTRYYEPTNNGKEGSFRKYLENLKGFKYED
jgi:putative ATPase